MKNECGAKTRAGAPCKRSPTVGKRRCKLHGGASTGAGSPARPGNQNARKHGIYSKKLTKEEIALMPLIKVGSVDDELTLTRILLLRALKAEREALKEGRAMEVVARVERGGLRGSYAANEVIRRRIEDRLYVEIDRLVARIASLEWTRVLLMAATQPDSKNS